jgi:multisubunit Na+/H+ antiporter MnhF subunit
MFFPLGVLFANGVSLQWMITLFLTSGYLRLYPLEISRWFSFIAMCLCLVVYNLCSHYFSDIVILDYNSLVTYCLAIFTFLWFKDWQLSNTNLFAKIVLFISSNIFAVYLIHEQWYLRTKYVVEWFNMFVGVVPNWLYLFVFGFIVIILCVLIDKVRVRLFKLAKLDLFIAYLGKRIDKFYI